MYRYIYREKLSYYCFIHFQAAFLAESSNCTCFFSFYSDVTQIQTQKCALSRLPNATNAVAVPFQWNTRPVHPLETLALNRGHRLSHAPQCISRANGHINPRANGLRRSTFANLGVIAWFQYVSIYTLMKLIWISTHRSHPQPISTPRARLGCMPRRP